MTSVHLRDISAAYGPSRVIEGITLDIPAGEFISLLGPSGCGKTTLLRIIAGLKEPQSGDLLFDDRSVTSIPAEKRGIAMVFQKPLLFPNLNVAENVAFGLKMKGVDGETRSRMVRDALAMVRMEAFGERPSRQLSGGQEQRIALARALVTEPRLLLLDEPFSALDEKLRAEMRDLVRSLQRKLGITTIFVTHDQNEAAALSDRIALLLDGGLEQVGPPRDFYLHPASESAARFFGWKIRRGELIEVNGALRLKTAIGSVELPRHAGRPTCIAFRSDQTRPVTPESRQPPTESFVFDGTIERITDLGLRLSCRVMTGDGEAIEIELPAGDRGSNYRTDARIRLMIDNRDLRFF